MNLLFVIAFISQTPELEPADVVIAPEVVVEPQKVDALAPEVVAPAIQAGTESPAPSPAIEGSKEVVYQKITNLELNGSKVEGEKGLPQEFFLYNVKTPKIRSFLEDRLKFSFRNYNELAN